MHFNRADLAAIAIGGVAGASLRWLITRSEPVGADWFAYEPNTSASLVPVELGFPTATLVVNLLGCLLLGALTMMLTRSTGAPRRLLVAAATGFCGSLTTLSTFAVEIAERLRGLPARTPRANIGQYDIGPHGGAAVVYLLVSLAAGAAAFWLGRTLATQIVTSAGPVTGGGPE